MTRKFLLVFCTPLILAASFRPIMRLTDPAEMSLFAAKLRAIQHKCQLIACAPTLSTPPKLASPEIPLVATR